MPAAVFCCHFKSKKRRGQHEHWQCVYSFHSNFFFTNWTFIWLLSLMNTSNVIIQMSFFGKQFFTNLTFVWSLFSWQCNDSFHLFEKILWHKLSICRSLFFMNCSNVCIQITFLRKLFGTNRTFVRSLSFMNCSNVMI